MIQSIIWLLLLLLFYIENYRLLTKSIRTLYFVPLSKTYSCLFPLKQTKTENKKKGPWHPTEYVLSTFWNFGNSLIENNMVTTNPRNVCEADTPSLGWSLTTSFGFQKERWLSICINNHLLLWISDVNIIVVFFHLSKTGWPAKSKIAFINYLWRNLLKPMPRQKEYYIMMF